MGPNFTIQGSVLASLLCLLNTLDFPSYFHPKVNTPKEDIISKESTVISFVDDTNSMIKEKEETELIDTMKTNL